MPSGKPTKTQRKKHPKQHFTPVLNPRSGVMRNMVLNAASNPDVDDAESDTSDQKDSDTQPATLATSATAAVSSPDSDILSGQTQESSDRATESLRVGGIPQEHEAVEHASNSANAEANIQVENEEVSVAVGVPERDSHASVVGNDNNDALGVEDADHDSEEDDDHAKVLTPQSSKSDGDERDLWHTPPGSDDEKHEDDSAQEPVAKLPE